MAFNRKHILLILSLFLIAACGKEQREEELFSAVFRVGTSADTKATAGDASGATASGAAASGAAASGATASGAAASGAASHVNRYIMEVYSADGTVFYDRVEKTVDEGTLETEMEVTLHVGISYNFVFWADCSEDGKDLFYTTVSEGDHGLRAVSMKSAYSGNDDRRDAFAASLLRSGHKAFEEKVVLRRPFARVSVLTDDLGILPVESVKPTSVGVRLAAYTCMDIMTGELSSEKEVAYTATPYYQLDSEPFVAGYSTLTMDYLFASDESAVLTSMEFTSHFADGASTSTFQNIPYRRNYKTNILGSVLTSTASYSIIIVPDFDGEI